MAAENGNTDALRLIRSFLAQDGDVHSLVAAAARDEFLKPETSIECRKNMDQLPLHSGWEEDASAGVSVERMQPFSGFSRAGDRNRRSPSVHAWRRPET